MLTRLALVLALPALILLNRASAEAQGPPRLLVISQPAPDNKDPFVDLGYVAARAISDGGRFDAVFFQREDRAVQEALQAGRLDAADLVSPLTLERMRKVASALGYSYYLRVSGHNTREGVTAEAQMERRSGPSAWRTVFAEGFSAFKATDRRSVLVQGLIAQASNIARRVATVETGPDGPAPTDADARKPDAPEQPARPAAREAQAGLTPAQPPSDARPVVPAPADQPTSLNAVQVERYRKLGDTANVIVFLQRLITERPRDPQLRRELIAAYRARGMADAARDEAARAVQVAPQDAVARRLLGECLLEAGEFDAALGALREAVTLDPKDAAAHIAMGDALWNTAKPDEAQRAYAAAAEAVPSASLPYRRLTRLHFQRGQYAEAVAAAKAAAERATEDDQKEIAAEYAGLLSSVEGRLTDILGLLQAARRDLMGSGRTREQIYKDVSDARKRSSDLETLLAELPSPTRLASAQGLFLQAAALCGQAVEAALTYLETMNESDDREATLLRVEAARQLNEAAQRLKALQPKQG